MKQVSKKSRRKFKRLDDPEIQESQRSNLRHRNHSHSSATSNHVDNNRTQAHTSTLNHSRSQNNNDNSKNSNNNVPVPVYPTSKAEERRQGQREAAMKNITRKARNYNKPKIKYRGTTTMARRKMNFVSKARKGLDISRLKRSNKLTLSERHNMNRILKPINQRTLAPGIKYQYNKFRKIQRQSIARQLVEQQKKRLEKVSYDDDDEDDGCSPPDDLKKDWRDGDDDDSGPSGGSSSIGALNRVGCSGSISIHSGSAHSSKNGSNHRYQRRYITSWKLLLDGMCCLFCLFIFPFVLYTFCQYPCANK